MTWIIDGFPLTNPILLGLDSLAKGGDLERALMERDALLATPWRFHEAAWEALAWLPEGSPLAMDLMRQGSQAWERLAPEEKDRFLGAHGTPVNNYQSQALREWQ